jgi:hypothetical protein
VLAPPCVSIKSSKSSGAWPAEGRDVDDAGRADSARQRQQFLGQQEAGQIVDREPQFVTVRALPPLPAVRFPRADAGVADQDVEAVAGFPHRGGERRDLREVGQQRHRLADCVGYGLQTYAVTTVQQQVVILGGEPGGQGRGLLRDGGAKPAAARGHRRPYRRRRVGAAPATRRSRVWPRGPVGQPVTENELVTKSLPPEDEVIS